MSTATTVIPATPARERLLAAADELFYAEGVHTVGIDRVIERAGVAKATLYSAFGSKDGLVRAYLMGRHEARVERITRGLERFATPRERLTGIFDVLGETVSEPTYRGCAFYNASAEAPPEGVAREVSDLTRGWTRTLLTGLAAEAGATDPEALGGQLVVLYDGAVVNARMDRDPRSAMVARSIAQALVDAAIPA